MPARLFSASQLMARQLPPVRWVVPGLLPEGVFLIAGKPKTGKSWLMLALAAAIAEGSCALGKYPTNYGRVLYLALEDTERRLQDRLRGMGYEDSAPDNLEFLLEHPRLDKSGLAELEAQLCNSPGIRLLVIDTLAKIRPASIRGAKHDYEGDYGLIGSLAELSKKHRMSIVVIHHLRKLEAEDPFDQVNGSTGLTGAADGTFVLQRARNSRTAKLHMTGRDIEEGELGLRWNPDALAWTAENDRAIDALTPERQAIYDALAESPIPLGPSEIAARLGKERNNVKQLMMKMEHQGQLVKEAEGKYRCPPQTTSKTTITEIPVECLIPE